MSFHLIRKITIANLIIIALLVAMFIGAQSSETTVQLEPNVVTGLISWIVAKTGWVVREPPSIRFIPHIQLVEMFCGRDTRSEDVNIRALHSPKGHIIYLPEDWNPNDLHDRSALLHELVHHLQALNNVKAMCLAAYEPQAYHLQLEWLREQGIQDPNKLIDIDEFTIRVLSQCPDG